MQNPRKSGLYLRDIPKLFSRDRDFSSRDEISRQDATSDLYSIESIDSFTGGGYKVGHKTARRPYNHPLLGKFEIVGPYIHPFPASKKIVRPYKDPLSRPKKVRPYSDAFPRKKNMRFSSALTRTCWTL